ncbi:MAG TPA: HAD-IA family hydrolase [Blastocatellia bacterium]|nr:HAD-IA family hydrolase [Blastocatellia bacterium]
MRDQTGAILFDLDGTLIDTTDLILECFRHSWERVCGFSHPRESYLRTFGAPLRDAMQQLLTRTADATESGGIDEPDRVIEQLLGEYRRFNLANHDRLALPVPGARESLAELRRRGYVIAVVTSKGRELATRGLRLCGLDSLVDSAVFLEDTNTHKPNPEPILAALDRLGTQPAEAVYVGDSRHDMRAARAAGVQTIAALWGPAPRAELEDERPDFLAESITDLLSIFNGRNDTRAGERECKE